MLMSIVNQVSPVIAAAQCIATLSILALVVAAVKV